MSDFVDLRCPLPAGKLLGKVKASGEEPTYTADNLIELFCRDCTKSLKSKDGAVERVLHRFNVLAEPVETVVTKSN